MTRVPFFAADLFEHDRAALLKTVYAVGTCDDQKFILGEQTARFEHELRR
ncbi:DegT/DnrJ/EryC1/StrS family aminotransferase, partial [Amycolatopsis sp. WAC 04182]